MPRVRKSPVRRHPRSVGKLVKKSKRRRVSRNLVARKKARRKAATVRR
jgi:hypothetical protein